jgi:coproporphyrinogen III oxidase-like Fe-S oxidoreductase
LEEYLGKNWLKKQGSTIILTKEGKFFADLIASNLFID